MQIQQFCIIALTLVGSSRNISSVGFAQSSTPIEVFLFSSRLRDPMRASEYSQRPSKPRTLSAYIIFSASETAWSCLSRAENRKASRIVLVSSWMSLWVQKPICLRNAGLSSRPSALSSPETVPDFWRCESAVRTGQMSAGIDLDRFV